MKTFLVRWVFRPMFLMLNLLLRTSKKQRNALVPTGRDEKFEVAIRSELRFLFEDYAAEVIENSYFRNFFGNALVKLRAQNVVVIIIKDRRMGADDIFIEVAPCFDDSASIPLEKLMWALEIIPRSRSYVWLSDVREILTLGFPAILTAFSESAFPHTLVKIRAIS